MMAGNIKDIHYWEKIIAHGDSMAIAILWDQFHIDNNFIFWRKLLDLGIVGEKIISLYKESGSNALKFRKYVNDNILKG